MPKIRDLGINSIPATMRPPELGPGGGLDMAVLCRGTDVTCGCTDLTDQCVPNSNCVAHSNRAEYSSPNLYQGGLTHAAVGQLKQQLHNYIGS